MVPDDRPPPIDPTTACPPERLTAADLARTTELCARDVFFWLDLADPTDAELETLASRLDLHPLAVEDTREWGQRPKLDAYRDHLFLVAYSAREVDAHVEPVEVHLFVSGRWIVTVRRGPCPALDALAKRDLAPGEAVLVHAILDTLVDAYESVISSIERRIDALEEEILAQDGPVRLERIYRLKQEVHAIDRRVAAQRDAFPSTVDALMELPGLDEGGRAYLRDVGDHLAQAAGELSRQTNDLQSLTDTYFNASANRLNQQATRLSIVATFFLVWTLVTGFFGQNFGWLVDAIDTRTDFLAIGLGALGLPTVVLAAYFWSRRREWFDDRG